MTAQDLFNPASDDKPLERIVSDGGYVGIFRTIAVIGDSLSSGEFESTATGETTYHDLFDYSWGQFIARDAGCKVYNFSRGGMTCHEYLNGFAEENGFWDKDKAAQAYIIALGYNDMYGCGLGFDEIKQNYAKIIERYKEIQPKARFFLVSAPKGLNPEDPKLLGLHNMLNELADEFEFTYVLDFYTYCPQHTQDYRNNFYLHGHLNPMGYRNTAKLVESYIDWIIRHNMGDFRQIGLIGTEFYDERFDKKD